MGLRRLGRRSVAALAVLVASVSVLMALGRPARASAARTNPMALGFVDDSMFIWSGDAVKDAWLGRAQALGSSVVRLPLNWAQTAPSSRPRNFQPADPQDRSYAWGPVDAAVRTADAHGQRILLMVYDAPRWAETKPPANFSYPGAWEPNAAMFGQFAHAVALRFSGRVADPEHPGEKLPAVRYLQAWNEPNLPYYLSPQWGRSSSGQIVPLSPGIYRSLLNAFYAGVKSAAPSDAVFAAGTAPYGDPPAGGQQRMHPVTFLDGLFCLSSGLRPLSCPNPPHVDGLDHHPYSLSPNVAARNPSDISVADLGKITRVVRAAEQYHHVVPLGPKPLWITELDWSEFKPLNTAIQARFLEEGFYDLWKHGVAVALWFQLRDPPTVHDSFSGAGLYRSSGTAKPAAAAYRFPFVAMPVRRRHHQFAVWGRAPGPGVVSVQEKRGGRWVTVLRLPTMAGGYFYSVRTLNWHLTLRAVSGRMISPVWRTSGAY